MAIGLSMGQCNSTAGAIYTCPDGVTASIKTIVLFNSNIAIETVKIYAVVNSGGSVGTASSSNQILSMPLSPNETFEFSPAYPIVLNAENDSIQGSSTTASKVNYIIQGTVG